MYSIVPLSKEQYYAWKLRDTHQNSNPNVINIHGASYWEEQLKKEHWRQFQQEQGKKYMEHLDKEVYNLFGKALDDLFEGWKK